MYVFLHTYVSNQTASQYQVYWHRVKSTVADGIHFYSQIFRCSHHIFWIWTFARLPILWFFFSQTTSQEGFSFGEHTCLFRWMFSFYDFYFSVMPRKSSTQSSYQPVLLHAFKFTTGLWSTSSRVWCVLRRLRILLPQAWFFSSWSVNVTECIHSHMLNQPYNLGEETQAALVY